MLTGTQEAPPQTTTAQTPATTPATTPVPTPAPTNTAPATTPEPAKTEPAKSILGSATTEPKTPDAKTQVPEVYKDFTLPEGISPDAKLLDGFKALAKEAGLSQEAAQKFVTLQAENVKAGNEALIKEAEVQRSKMLEEYKQQTIKDLGADYQKELGFAAKALDRFGNPELRKLMDETGFGNHPLMVKTWVSIGKAMAEDNMPGPSGSGPSNDDATQLRTMFPSMFNEDGSKKN